MASDIEWTDDVWNPVVGCARVSPGCENCYAEKIAHRGMSPQHRGLTKIRIDPKTGKPKGVRWTGEARFVPEVLGKPLRWRKPKRVFVNSMSDLFHADVSMEQIAAVFGVMAATPHLTYQVLTKRPLEMLDFFRWVEAEDASSALWRAACELLPMEYSRGVAWPRPWVWPLQNVHLGVSVEDQRRADERIPLLLQCPAALRFLSVEPLLEAIDFGAVRGPTEPGAFCPAPLPLGAKIDWVIVGGESGPGARPFCDEWARSIVGQCREAGVPVFVKQMGSAPTFRACGCVGERCRGGHLCNGITRPYRLRDRKGGDMAEWPEDLRVRELPTIGGAPCA